MTYTLTNTTNKNKNVVLEKSFATLAPNVSNYEYIFNLPLSSGAIKPALHQFKCNFTLSGPPSPNNSTSYSFKTALFQYAQGNLTS